MVTDDYFSTKRQVDELKLKIKRLERETDKNTEESLKYGARLKELLENYYALVNLPSPHLETVTGILKACKNLPELADDYYLKTDSTRRYELIGRRLADKQIELSNTNKKIKQIQTVREYANKTLVLHRADLARGVAVAQDNVICPICSQDVPTMLEEARKYANAMHNLNLEIASMANFARYDSEQLEALKSSRRNLLPEIKNLEEELKTLDVFEKT
ncbi:hypothetical protein M5C90_19175 [Pseudomonas chlororaphis subsp. piscium]|nr:hypothetical protein M5C90_19175 [Pseudomonas chlororaphis subsp. piscium]